MIKYFIDTEFIEGFHKPLFGKRRHFIDLISIGIQCEDGRSLHFISNEYNYHDADKWVQENVLLPLYKDTVYGDMRNKWGVDNFQKLYGVSNKEIAEHIKTFVNSQGKYIGERDFTWPVDDNGDKIPTGDPEFYAYYADYDWVVFCSLFGRMIDLPGGFPMYCRDLKQMLDEKQAEWINKTERERLQYCAGKKLFSVEIDLKGLSNYPQQKNEHSALDDAKWNFELYKFLNDI